MALDTQDRVLFTKIFNVAEFSDFIETLLPHLLGLEIDFRRDILAKITERIPDHFNSPIQYLNLLQLLQLKGDYENTAKIIYDLVKRGQR